MYTRRQQAQQAYSKYAYVRSYRQRPSSVRRVEWMRMNTNRKYEQNTNSPSAIYHNLASLRSFTSTAIASYYTQSISHTSQTSRLLHFFSDPNANGLAPPVELPNGFDAGAAPNGFAFVPGAADDDPNENGDFAGAAPGVDVAPNPPPKAGAGVALVVEAGAAAGVDEPPKLNENEGLGASGLADSAGLLAPPAAPAPNADGAPPPNALDDPNANPDPDAGALPLSVLVLVPFAAPNPPNAPEPLEEPNADAVEEPNADVVGADPAVPNADEVFEASAPDAGAPNADGAVGLAPNALAPPDGAPNGLALAPVVLDAPNAGLTGSEVLTASCDLKLNIGFFASVAVEDAVVPVPVPVPVLVPKGDAAGVDVEVAAGVDTAPPNGDAPGLLVLVLLPPVLNENSGFVSCAFAGSAIFAFSGCAALPVPPVPAPAAGPPTRERSEPDAGPPAEAAGPVVPVPVPFCFGADTDVDWPNADEDPEALNEKVGLLVAVVAPAPAVAVGPAVEAAVGVGVAVVVPNGLFAGAADADADGVDAVAGLIPNGDGDDVPKLIEVPEFGVPSVGAGVFVGSLALPKAEAGAPGSLKRGGAAGLFSVGVGLLASAGLAASDDAFEGNEKSVAAADGVAVLVVVEIEIVGVVVFPRLNRFDAGADVVLPSSAFFSASFPAAVTGAGVGSAKVGGAEATGAATGVAAAAAFFLSASLLSTFLALIFAIASASRSCFSHLLSARCGLANSDAAVAGLPRPPRLRPRAPRPPAGEAGTKALMLLFV
jgi:hypothetical protein